MLFKAAWAVFTRQELQAKPKMAEARLWKRNKAVERGRREYKTAEEILAGQEEKTTIAAQPILDMRGPQARLITDMEALNATAAEIDGETIPMPELQHNLRLLVDLSAAEIQRIDGKLRHSKVWVPRLPFELCKFCLFHALPV